MRVETAKGANAATTRRLPRGMLVGFSRQRVDPATLVLALLVVAGLALRIVALASWWPATTTVSDGPLYANYASTNPLADPLHPAGYSSLLALVWVLSREIAFTIILQHVAGVLSALVFFAAVRRLTGSPWPALVPAAVILLNADQVFLEHNIMSEAAFVLALAATFYAAVRALDAPIPWWRWPAAAAALAVLATVIRTAALFVIPVIALAIVLAGPRPWRARFVPALCVLGLAGALLAGYATANLINNERFELAPTHGWHLYGRAAPFADCRQFTPPGGTQRLCETIPPAQRPSLHYYLYDPASPAKRLYGRTPWVEHDSDLGAWARKAIIAQPHDYALAMWRDLRHYYTPADPDLPSQWVAEDGGTASEIFFFAVKEVETKKSLERFFNPFSVHKSSGRLAFLQDYQRVLRFEGPELAVATLLCLLGLLIGSRRSRVGVLLFGLGGLALLVPPTLSVYYVDRYRLPLAGPMAAGAAIAVWGLTTTLRRSALTPRRPRSRPWRRGPSAANP